MLSTSDQIETAKTVFRELHIGEAPSEPPPAAQIDLNELPLTIEQWRTRDLPNPDFISGSWLSTTSRALISAPTGLGKSNLVIALGQHVAAGLPFLHWSAGRRAKTLYIDGEMSRRLLKERIFAEEQRHSGDLDWFYTLSHEDISAFRRSTSREDKPWSWR